MVTMLLVSCRKDFWSATEFSKANEVRRVDLSSGAGEVVESSDFLERLAGRRVTVLVHGYNNEELDVLRSYATIESEMRLLRFLGVPAAPYDAVVGFAWPGGALGVSFPFARQRAAEAAPRFARLLADLRSAGASIDLNTHSLGAHVAFEALRTATPRAVRNAWNFASTVDNESIEFRERYYPSARHCDRFFVFHSKNDPVLRVWYRVGDLFDFDTALGYSGPEDPAAIINHSPNVRVINCKEVVRSHGGYRSCGQVWAYMSRELAQPSTEQFVTLSLTPAALTAVFRATGGTMPARRVETRRRAGKPRRT
jgi:esterase/lipase superfamily enzyme